MDEILIDSEYNEFYSVPVDDLVQFTSAYQGSNINAIKLSLKSCRIHTNILAQAIDTLKNTKVSIVDVSEEEFSTLGLDGLTQIIAAFESTHVTIIYLNRVFINSLDSNELAQVFLSLPLQIKQVIVGKEVISFPQFYLKNKGTHAYQQKLVKYLVQFIEKQLAQKETSTIKTIEFPFYVSEALLSAILPLLEQQQTDTANFICQQLLLTTQASVNTEGSLNSIVKTTQHGQALHCAAANDDPSMYVQQLRSLNPQELDSHISVVTQSSELFYSFLYHLRFFHGHEIMDLLQHDTIIDNIFTKDSDDAVEFMLIALCCSVNREEIHSDSLVNFLERYAINELVWRSVAVRQQFFELLQRSFRSSKQDISEFLLKLFSKHSKIYSYEKDKILCETMSRAVQLTDIVSRQKMLHNVALHVVMLRTTLLALFNEIECAGQADTIRPVVNYMLPRLGISLKTGEHVSKKEAALLAKQICNFLNFENDEAMKRSHNLLKIILSEPCVSSKYKLLLLEELNKKNFILHKYYKTKLDYLNRMKNYFARFFGIRRCVDVSDMLSERQLDRYLSLAQYEESTSPSAESATATG